MLSSVQQITQKISEIVKAFRGLLYVDLKLESLTTANDIYTAKGAYKSTTIFSNKLIEEGTFEIRLNSKDLSMVSVTIQPKNFE